MLLFYNAKIYNLKKLQGILVENEKIKEINDSDFLVNKYNYIKKIDLKGKTVVPGFNDSHLHLLNYSFIKSDYYLNDKTSIEQIINEGIKYLDNNPKVVIGNRYHEKNLKENRLLTKHDLDQISKDIPIICYRVCGHIATVNSKVIELLNLSKETTIDGGDIDLDAAGNPTGVLRENALNLLVELVNRDYSVEKLKKLIMSGIEDCNKFGLTSLQTNDISGNLENAKKIFTAYKELDQENKLNARIYHQITFDTTNDLQEFIDFANYESNYLKVGPLKLFLDGSLGGKTAALYNNYLGENHNGMLCLTLEQLEDFIDYSTKINRQVIIHAIGDRAIDICLDKFAKVNKKYGNKYNNIRHGIVHVQITSNEILEKFKETKVCALVQPIFINTDMKVIYDRVDKKLSATSYSFKTLYDITMTSFGSDAPVESFNPFYSIYNAVTRMDLEGKQIYNLDQKVNVEEAINAYTELGAYMSFEEKIKGKIAVGQLADFIVLDRDIYEILSEEIKNVNVDLTIVGGKVVYEK